MLSNKPKLSIMEIACCLDSNITSTAQNKQYVPNTTEPGHSTINGTMSKNTGTVHIPLHIFITYLTLV